MNIQNFHNLKHTNRFKEFNTIVLSITNNSDAPKSCKLFFGDKTNNYGNPACIKIDNVIVNEKYSEIISCVNKEVFITSLIRLQSENISQLTQIMVMVFQDGSYEDGCQIPLIVQSSQSYDMLHEYKTQDIPYEMIIDKDLHLTITILGKTTLKLIFFSTSYHSEPKFKSSKELFDDFKENIKNNNGKFRIK